QSVSPLSRTLTLLTNNNAMDAQSSTSTSTVGDAASLSETRADARRDGGNITTVPDDMSTDSEPEDMSTAPKLIRPPSKLIIGTDKTKVTPPLSKVIDTPAKVVDTS